MVAIFDILTWPVVHVNVLFFFHHCDPQRLRSIPPERQQAFFIHTNVKRYICLLVPHVVSNHLMDLAVATFGGVGKDSTIRLLFSSRKMSPAPPLLPLHHQQTAEKLLFHKQAKPRLKHLYMSFILLLLYLLLSFVLNEHTLLLLVGTANISLDIFSPLTASWRALVNFILQETSI